MDKEKDTKTKLPTRPLRISRANAKISTTIRNTKPEEKPPEEKSPSPKKESPKDDIETIQTVSRNPPRGRGRARGRGTSRRNRRTNINQNRRNRLQRAENATIKRNSRRRFFRNRNNDRFRKRFGLREIFIAGLPGGVNNRRLFNLLKKEGRVVRCNVVFDRYGYSKGIAFAEFQSQRDAWRVVNRWRGRRIGKYTIFVAFRRRRRVRRNNNYERFRNYRGRGGRFGQNQRGFSRGGFGNRYRGRGRRGGYRGN